MEESKDHFKLNIGLPTELPPIPFTHSVGRLNDLEGDENDELEIKFINENSPQNHYIIRITPIEHGLKIKDEDIDQKLKLKDGNDAIFSTMILGFNLLIFEKNEWQYVLSIDKRVSDKVTLDILMNIANSTK